MRVMPQRSICLILCLATGCYCTRVAEESNDAERLGPLWWARSTDTEERAWLADANGVRNETGRYLHNHVITRTAVPGEKFSYREAHAENSFVADDLESGFQVRFEYQHIRTPQAHAAEFYLGYVHSAYRFTFFRLASMLTCLAR